MNSVLSIVCIIFFAALTNIFIKGYNEKRDHKYDCRTLLIPEDIDLDAALESITGIDTNGLKKRALELGASQAFVDKTSDIDLKIYIIQESIEEKHIPTVDIESKIKERESGRRLLRQMSSDGRLLNINQEQVPELNPNITIAELRRDYDE